MLYTDGITEAIDAAQTLFGEERLLPALQARVGSDASQIRDGLLADLRLFVGDGPQADDVALLVVKRRG